VRDRYDGRKRNPWNEEECGHNYIRPLAAYSLLLALSGFRCDASKGIMQFAPIWSPEQFRTFWSAGTGWGDLSLELQNGQLSIQLNVHGGAILLKQLELTWPDDCPPKTVRIAANTVEPARVSIAGRHLSVNWDEETKLIARRSLKLAIASTVA
jgi:hypothetical protein